MRQGKNGVYYLHSMETILKIKWHHAQLTNIGHIWFSRLDIVMEVNIVPSILSHDIFEYDASYGIMEKDFTMDNSHREIPLKFLVTLSLGSPPKVSLSLSLFQVRFSLYHFVLIPEF